MAPSRLYGSGSKALLLLLLSVVLYFALAYDEQHHWHEWRYMYSAAHYTETELRLGLFDPGPPPERSADEIGAWYWGQMLHLTILRTAVQVLGLGETVIQVTELLYGLFVAAAILLAMLTLRQIRVEINPGQFAVLSLLSPLSVYLGFKLMPEGLALLLASAAIWVFALGVSATSVWRWVAWGGAVFLTALSFLAMGYMPLLVYGFIVAWACCWAKESTAARWSGSATVIIGSIVLSIIFAAVFYEITVNDYFSLYLYFSQYLKPLLVSLFGIITAWSAMYVFVILSGFSPHRRTLRFFLVWLLVSLPPLLLLSHNYIESRFLSVGLFPMAGLSVLGLAWIAQRMGHYFRRADSRSTVWIMILTLVPLVSWATLPFMPYEMNSGELRRLVQRVHKMDAGAAVLIPWNYTDFHYLRVAFPHRAIYLVQSPINKNNDIIPAPHWTRRRQHAYGDMFIKDRASLKRLEGQTLYYVGHGMLPPFQNLKRVASVLGLEAVTKRIDDMNSLNHILLEAGCGVIRNSYFISLRTMVTIVFTRWISRPPGYEVLLFGVRVARIYQQRHNPVGIDKRHHYFGRQSSSAWCSNTIRTARSRTFGEYLVLLFITPSSQEMESPVKSGRFKRRSWWYAGLQTC